MTAIAASTDHRRWPETRGNVESGEDPDHTVLAASERADLVCLNLGDIELCDGRVVELAAARCCPLQPAIYGIPADPFHSSDGRLVHALDTERGDLVEGAATMLKAVVRGVYGGAEGLAACLAAIAGDACRPLFCRSRSE